jgi:FkbM family methyltransferase
MQPRKLASGRFNHLSQCRYGLMLYNVNDLFIGRSLDLYGEFSEGEVNVFRQMVRPGDIVLDVGANIGAHTLFLANAVGRQGKVYAFEPQRIVFQTLCANMALNSVTNAYCYHVAVGDRPGSILVPALNYEVPENFGGLGLGDARAGEEVQFITLDSLALPTCRLIKVDVEGMELHVLQGARATIDRLRPVLYVENDRAEKSEALMRFIDQLGYEMYWHLPTYYSAQNYYGNANNVFGNIVSGNLFCVHPSQDVVPRGFERALPGERSPFAR